MALFWWEYDHDGHYYEGRTVGLVGAIGIVGEAESRGAISTIGVLRPGSILKDYILYKSWKPTSITFVTLGRTLEYGSARGAASFLRAYSFTPYAVDFDIHMNYITIVCREVMPRPGGSKTIVDWAKEGF